MRSNVWRGLLQGICWQHAAETRVSGFGKVCIKLQCVTTSDAMAGNVIIIVCVAQWMKRTIMSVLPW